jgi:hypothetical protein
MAGTVGLIGYGMARGQLTGDAAAPAKEGEPKARKDAVVKERAEKEEAVAWGQEVDGLQAGLAADPITCRQGERLKLTVKLRNVGKAEVTVTYGILRECAPQVATDTGGRVSVYMPPSFRGYAVPTKRVLKPGETITLYNPEVAVESEALTRLQGLIRVETPTICVEPGKYKIAYGGMIQSHRTLTTGTVEFEVKDQVAWGKEVGGLQAGLGYKSEKRAYRIGETVTLVVRVRNVGKEAVKFRYCRETYFEEPPAVTDGKGKPIPLERDRATGFAALVPVTLAPGQEIEVGERQLELKPALFGTGTFGVQYERLETPENDKTLSKLSTGKLELEVK